MMISSHIFFIFALIGLLSGFLSGLTGMGGGLIIVPALIDVFHHVGMVHQREAQTAIATSLAVLVVTLSLAVFHFHKAKIIDWHIVRAMMPTMILGGCIGPWLSAFFSSRVLSIFFAILMLAISLQVFLSKPAVRNIKPPKILRLYAFFIGIISGLLGIAGGSFIIPFLMRQGVLAREAAAISTTTILPVVILATVSYIVSGRHHTDLSVGTLGYIYLPAVVGIAFFGVVTVPIGIRVALKLSNVGLRKIFAGIIFLLALRLLAMNFL